MHFWKVEPGGGEKGRVEDETGDGELGGQVQRGRRAQALSVQDDPLRFYVILVQQQTIGRLSIGVHGPLGWRTRRLTETGVVVDEDVTAESVSEREEKVAQVAQVDGAAVAEEYSKLGRLLRLEGLNHQTGNLVATG